MLIEDLAGVCQRVLLFAMPMLDFFYFPGILFPLQKSLTKGENLLLLLMLL